jgi:hypothetical protein
MKYDTFIMKCSGSITGYFMPELQTGFSVSSQEGVTIYSFLTDYCGISDEYLSDKIKTIMIDGGPVDDIFNTKVHNGGVCALSGAMPGIVGAMMRIGSPYAAMRESITVKPEGSKESGREILVDLKLFNVILADKGAGFLKRGILLQGKRIINLFKKHGDDIFSCCREVMFNGEPADLKKLLTDSGSMDRLMMLKLEIEDES